MKYFKKLDLPTYQNALYDLNNLLSKKIVKWSQNQICVNTIETDPDNYELGTGSLDHDWTKSYKIEENGITKIVVPPRDFPLTDRDFTTVCSQFRGTVFEEIITMLKKHYSLGRVRIMKSEPKTCLSWHIDHSPRLHFPIKTQAGCFMVIEDEVIHMPETTWWWANTVEEHTAFNASKESRIHLVVCLLDQ